MLRVSPLIGSVLDPGSAVPQAVLSEQRWRSRFGRDASILGRRIRVSGQEAVVSGIAPAGFAGATQLIRADMWLPVSLYTRVNPSPKANTTPMFGVLGRLAPGVTQEQARLQLDSLVAGLMLARGPGRSHEIGIRLALGAAPGRIARQIMTESLVLGLAGSALGAVLAYTLTYAAPPLGAELPEHLAYAVDIHPDWRVFTYAGITAVVVSILFGLAPARQAARTDFMEALKQSGASR